MQVFYYEWVGKNSGEVAAVKKDADNMGTLPVDEAKSVIAREKATG